MGWELPAPRPRTGGATFSGVRCFGASLMTKILEVARQEREYQYAW